MNNAWQRRTGWDERDDRVAQGRAEGEVEAVGHSEGVTVAQMLNDDVWAIMMQ